VLGAIGHHGMGSRHGACAPKGKNKIGVPGHAGSVWRAPHRFNVKGVSETFERTPMAQGGLARGNQREIVVALLPRSECGLRIGTRRGCALHVRINGC